MAAIFMGLMIAGCVDPEPSPSRSQVGALLVEGRISYNLTVEDQEDVGSLDLTGPFEATDRFHRTAMMYRAVDRFGIYVQDRWILPEMRRIEMAEGKGGGWYTKQFDQRSLPWGSAGLVPLLLLAHGRDWHAGATYEDFLWGHDHTLVGAWTDDELTVRGKSEISGFEARFSFAPEGRDIHALRKVLFARDDDGSRIDHNATFHIGGTNGSLQPIDLPVHSTKPTTIWKPLALDEFLDASRLPLVFPLKRAWESLEQDPRTMEWMTGDPEPLVAYYHNTGSGLMPGGRWSLQIGLEDGYGSAHIEQDQVAGQDLVPIVRTYDKRDTSHHEPLPALYGWDAVLENCVRHAGVEPAAVKRIEFSGPHMINEYHQRVLAITYTPDTDEYKQVDCYHDSVTGLPISVVAAPMEYIL